MRNPGGDRRLRELERRALYDVQAAHAYAAELDRRGMRKIDLPQTTHYGGYYRGTSRPAFVVFHPGTPENVMGWYVVAANGTWTHDLWSSGELALQAAHMIEHIRPDGSVYLRSIGIEVA